MEGEREEAIIPDVGQPPGAAALRPLRSGDVDGVFAGQGLQQTRQPPRLLRLVALRCPAPMPDLAVQMELLKLRSAEPG